MKSLAAFVVGLALLFVALPQNIAVFFVAHKDTLRTFAQHVLYRIFRTVDNFMPGLPDTMWAIAMPQMASVMLSDVIIPAVYMSYTAVDSPELTAFFESGVAVRSAVLDSAFQAGGTLVNMPFWKDLDPTIEPNYSTDAVTDVATPNKIIAGVMKARVANMNQGYSSADLVAELAGSNPMQRIRNRFGTYWTRQWQRRVIATINGILADNIANGGTEGGANGDMVNSIAIETTVGLTSANMFSRAAFTGSAFTLGDHFEKVAAIAVHSVVFKRMVDNDDIAFERPATTDPNLPIGIGSVPYFLGKRVIVDDSMPVVAGSTSGFKYVSALFGEGVIGYGENLPLVPVEVYRRPDQGNGGGIEQVWERKSMVIQPFGYKWNDASVAGQSATLAEVATASNWTRVVERKNVPLAFLITNG